MTNTKQVKVDNWGVFFLQRLKHFFNRTDYCDLTLQFQGYAQLKVHRLVLNACTEYFEMLERTCEMYDNCLIMPHDLQVDVMVPIINFMYTGQLEYENHIFDRLYTTTKAMNMTVLTKLLDAQREEVNQPPPPSPKKEIILMNSQIASGTFSGIPSTSSDAFKIARETSRKRLSGRQYGRAPTIPFSKVTKPEMSNIISIIKPPVVKKERTTKFEKPRPTRYEVPEELENENLFETSFSDISYGSQPLMKSFTRERPEPEIKIKSIYDEASCSRKFEELQASSSSYKRARADSSEDNKNNIMEQIEHYNYEQKSKNNFLNQSQSEDDIFDTSNDTLNETDSLFPSTQSASTKPPVKSTVSNLDHAKIISEVLKKYPHLVKSNKNIKLKIMPGNDKSSSRQPQSIVIDAKKIQALSSGKFEPRFGHMNPKIETTDPDEDWSFINKNVDQESVARLVSMGVSNTTGPWLCLICGTPGKALNFTTYNKYYRHLADVHLEKISANICEHCGYKSGKRNHLLHHMYTKHGIPPPLQYSFPKCNQCDYVALTKAFLIKHKLTHVDSREFSCNVCNSFYKTRSSLLSHIQSTGHKISPDRKTTNQCVYCNKIFLREANLYTHLKLTHKELARKDGIIDNSDDDDGKYEDSTYEYSDSPKTEHVSIKQEYDGKIQIISNIPVNPIRKPNTRPSQTLLNTKLLNSNILDKVKFVPDSKYATSNQSTGIEISSENESLTNVASGIATSLGLSDRIVMFNDDYVIQPEQEQEDIPMHQPNADQSEAILPDLPEQYYDHSIEVSMPQQTSTSQIMTQKHLKGSYKASLPDIKSIQGHQIHGQQTYKTLVSTPVVFSTHNMATISTNASSPKYVQSQPGNISLNTTSGETIMYLQDTDLNMDQSNTSNIVVVYSHPIDREQFPNQYTANQETVIEGQGDQMNSENDIVMTDQGLIEETASEDNVENSQIISETHASQEIVDQQDIPEANNETVEIITEQSISTDDVTDETQTHEIVVSNEDKDYSEEIVEYEETTEEIANEEETVSDNTDGSLSIANDQNDVQPVQQTIQADNIVNNQVEWSDDEISTKEIQGSAVAQEENTEEMEVMEESIENIEKEVQKHLISDKPQSATTEILKNSEVNIISPEKTSEELIENEEEEMVVGTEDTVDVEEQPITEETIESEDTNMETNEPIVEEDQLEAEATATLPDKNDENEEVAETNKIENSQRKSIEKISTLLHDWDDNDSQPETTCEDQEEPADETNEHKMNENVTQSNGNNSAVKVANIEKIVSDWDEDEEK